MFWLLTLPFRIAFGLLFALIALPFALLALPFALLALPFLLLRLVIKTAVALVVLPLVLLIGALGWGSRCSQWVSRSSSACCRLPSSSWLSGRSSGSRRVLQSGPSSFSRQATLSGCQRSPRLMMRCRTRLVAEPDLLGRRREILTPRNLRIRVRFEHPDMSRLVQPQVDARVAAQLERAVGTLADVLNLARPRLRADPCRAAVDAVFLLVLHAPLHAVGGDAPEPLAACS